ncbi:MAG: hypothetical protein IPM56_04900 [Ignavibacteriales bacterium]|nr:MAG: hypothetical protein IPM56_04900 [Ignavibacteriales bacterium]
MKKIQYCFFIIALIIGCSDSNENERFFNETLERKVLYSKTDSVAINIKELVRFDWDYFIVIPPYTTIDRLEDSIDVKLEKVKDTRIETNDSFVVLAFIKEHTLIDCFTTKYHPIDFSVLKPFLPYKKEEANFIFVKNGNKYFPYHLYSKP